MDLHLQNVLTGETVKLAPARTLIGTAEHATFRTAEDGPYLAALAVRYPTTGWSLFGLSDESSVMHNRRPLHSAQRVALKPGDLLAVGDERFTFLSPSGDPVEAEPVPAPACFAYIRNPDGMEECRAVDHDLLFGRLAHCHVQLADTRLSRLAALLASHGGAWYVHTLSKKPLGRNRKAVSTCAPVQDGDELLIGPLVVRIEMRDAVAADAVPRPVPSAPGLDARRPSGLPHASLASATDFDETTDDGSGADEPAGPDLRPLRAGAERMEQWLKAQNPSENGAPKGGLGGWLGAQRDRLRRFWYDTPETTAARGLRTAGRVNEAFVVLDRAIRVRPDGPELLRELYRLYEAVGFTDLCFRPLRQIEKLAEARGAPDTWVLEALARVCERMGRERPPMIDRAIGYWRKLEAATGESYLRQRNETLAKRALWEGGYAGAAGDTM